MQHRRYIVHTLSRLADTVFRISTHGDVVGVLLLCVVCEANAQINGHELALNLQYDALHGAAAVSSRK